MISTTLETLGGMKIHFDVEPDPHRGIFYIRIPEDGHEYALAFSEVKALSGFLISVIALYEVQT